MKKAKHLIIINLLILVSLGAFGCDEDELSISMSYPEMLEQAFNETGEGRIIPVTIENAIEVDGSLVSNGRYFFYTSNKYRGNYDIYLRSMRDITTVKVISHASSDYSSAISPNGKYLAFVSEREDPEGDIYVLRVKSRSLIRDQRDIKKKVSSLDSDAKNISQIVEAGTRRKTVVRDSNPTWSPDSKLIAFSSERNGIGNIYICERDGDNLQQITTEGGMYPSFSPDGKKIVYISYRNPKNNGDIYVVDLETREDIQITDTLSVEMSPAFSATTDEIIYTLIDKDTNNDRIIDLKDRSVIQYRNLVNNHSYALTFYSNSTFSPRYFPYFGQKYSESDVDNFMGVIVFSQQVGNNIDLNLIPEYGVIPKRENAQDQFELALRYLNEYNDYDKYNEALMRVFYFFYQAEDSVSRTFIARAIRARAQEYVNNREREKIAGLITAINSINREEEKDYVSVSLDYLSALLSGSNEESVLKEAASGLAETMYAPFVLEDLGNYYRKAGLKVKATDVYENLLATFPDYERKMYISEFLAAMNYNAPTEEISPYYIEILNNGAAYQKDATIRALSTLFMSGYVPSRRLMMMDLYRELYGSREGRAADLITALSIYIKQLTLFQQSDSAASPEELITLLKDVSDENILYYRINKLLADMALRQKDATLEEKYLSRSVNSYKERWRQNDLEEIIMRLIDIYENKGLAFEKKGELKKAVKIYEGYTGFLSALKSKRVSKFEYIYNGYGARSHILYIDAYMQLKGATYSNFERLVEKYEDGAAKARKNYDKAHIYGLGYLYSRYALFCDKEYQNTYEITKRRSRVEEDEEEELDSEQIASLFYKSVEALNWALFMDDSFSDPYLLKGWIYQYLDYRREFELRKEYPLGKHLEAYFPASLLEDNIETYEKALSANNELRYAEKEGNLHLNLGNTYFMLRNYPEAIIHYNAVAKYKKNFSSKKEEAYFRFHLGYCNYQMGNNQESLKEFNRVESIFKDISGGKINRLNVNAFIMVYRYYGLISQMEGKYSDSIKWYNAILNEAAKYNIKIDRARYYQEIANCHIELKEYKTATEHINRADRLIKNDDSREFWIHNLDAEFLGLIPLPLFDFEDMAVVGAGRIYREFDLETKSYYSLSLLEKIHYTKGDYRSVIKVQKKKLKLLKGKKRIFHNEIRLRALNNLGHAYFVLGDYKESENYFLQAWETSDSLGDNEGMFMAIQNMTSLYSFILENKPDYYENPISEINKIIVEIDSYSEAYEKKEYSTRLDQLEDTRKKRGLDEPTPEDRRLLAREVAEDAKRKFFKLEINKATLNFYKAELLHDSYVNSLAKEKADTSEIIFSSNRNIFQYYYTSAEIFEKASEGDAISQQMKLKLMLNATISRQKLGQAAEAYSVLEKALKISKYYQFDEISYLIYYKQARFLEENSKAIGISAKKTGERYENAIAIIEELPQQFYNRESMVNNIYNDYTRYLISEKQYTKALRIQQRKRSVALINATYLSSPSFGTVSEKNLFDSYKNIVSNLLILKRNYSNLLEKYNDQSRPEIVRMKNEIATYKEHLSIINYENPLLQKLIKQSVTDFDSGNSVIYEFMRNGNDLHVWRVDGQDVDYSSLELDSDDKLKRAINGHLKETASAERPVYLIFNETMKKTIGEIKAEAVETDPVEFMYICSFQDLTFLEKTGKTLNRNEYTITDDLEELLESKEDLIKYSVIIDNKLSSFDTSENLFSKKIRPSLLIKSFNDAPVSQNHLLYYSALYAGASNLVLHSNGEKYKEFTTFSQFNSLQNGKKTSYSFGINRAVFPDDTERIDVVNSLYDQFQSSLLQGDPASARFYLFRWYEAAKSLADTEVNYLFNLAQVYDYEFRSDEAVNELKKVDLSTIENVESYKRVVSHIIYYYLRAGDITGAENYMEDLPDIEIDSPIVADADSETDSAIVADADGETDGVTVADADSETDGATVADADSETDGATVADADSETDGATVADADSETDSVIFAETDIYKRSADYRFFSNLITSVKNYQGGVFDFSGTTVQTYKLAVLTARFLSTYGKYNEAANALSAVKETDLLNYSDLLFVNSLVSFRSPYVRDPRVLDIIDIRQMSTYENLRDRYLSVVEIAGLHDSYSKYSVLMALDRLTGLLASQKVNEVVKEDSLTGIGLKGAVLDQIFFFVKVSDYLYQTGSYENSVMLLNQALSVADKHKTQYAKGFLHYRLAQYHAREENFVEVESALSNIDEIAVANSLYADVKLLQAEVMSRNGENEDSQKLISSIYLVRNDHQITRRLIGIYNDYLMHKDSGDDLVGFLSNNQTVLDEALLLLKNERAGVNVFERYLFFDEVLNCFIEANANAGNNSNAIALAERKKQIRLFQLFPEELVVSESLYDAKTRAFLKGESVLKSLEDVYSVLADKSAVLYFEKVQSDIYVWVIGNKTVNHVVLKNGYLRFSELTEMYEANLLSFYPMSATTAGFNSLFVNLLTQIEGYDKFYVVSSSKLHNLPLELMGEIALIENNDISYLPALSVLSSNKDKAVNKTVFVLQSENELVNDYLELLAIKESGLIQKTAVEQKSFSDMGITHVQQELFWEPVAGVYVLKGNPYSEVIGNQYVTYVSTNSCLLNDPSSFVLYNLALGNTAVVLNRTMIRDINSAILVREFYSGLRRGESASSSFSNALRKIYYNNQISHPSYWSKTRLYESAK
jgi:tetratricopeptide (TPR) repeat protein